MSGSRLRPLLLVSIFAWSCDVTVGALPEGGAGADGVAGVSSGAAGHGGAVNEGGGAGRGGSAGFAAGAGAGGEAGDGQAGAGGEGGDPGDPATCTVRLRLPGEWVEDTTLEKRVDTEWAHFDRSNLQAAAWTYNGGWPRRTRFFFKPPLPALLGAPNVERAQIEFRAGSTSEGCYEAGGGHSRRDGSNATVWRRVLAAWSEPTLTWSTQPPVDPGTRLPPSESNFAPYTFDVTTYAREVYSGKSPHWGFAVELETEQPYRSVCFSSSDSPIVEQRPELVLQYADAPCCAPPLDGMLAWWSDDRSAVPAFGPELVVTGADRIAGRVGDALAILGDATHVYVDDPAALNRGTADFSIALWIRTLDSEGIKLILDKRSEATPLGLGYSLYLSGGVPILRLADTSSAEPCIPGATCQVDFSAGRNVADGQWHHLVVSVARQQENGLRFMIDGATVATHDPRLRSGSLDNPGKFTIGCRSETVSGCITGALDEVQIHGRALTETEGKAEFEAGVAGTCRPLQSSSE